MTERRLDLTAAPPDSAGHQGSFTRPDEDMMVADADGPAVGGPPTDRDPARPVQDRGGAGAVWLWLAVFVVAIALFVYAQFGG